MIQPYSESPTCPGCGKPLLQRYKAPGTYAYFPPTKHICRRCKIVVVSWIVLIKRPSNEMQQVVLPLNYTDYGDTPEEFWKSLLFDSRELLVLTADELMRETDGSSEISVEDILGLYISSRRAAFAN